MERPQAILAPFELPGAPARSSDASCFRRFAIKQLRVWDLYVEREAPGHVSIPSWPWEGYYGHYFSLDTHLGLNFADVPL